MEDLGSHWHHRPVGVTLGNYLKYFHLGPRVPLLSNQVMG